ncbi:hypothetical protein OFDDKENP_00087 [Aeromonas phage B614]|nr:hypothetical protein OFDDKENP_00087 [Aeromonas phage B614]UYD58186.1 hypothetical protein JNEOFJEA_00089 [Aeromonas phage UP87]UYD58549.1 hypothetical protein IPAKJDPM_00206 [Aeromonas phage avDM14-QBC]UYD58764.1 hypothetical protein HNNIDBEH_00171 [Aeromonas phage avDM10-HWA]UYD58932.1 hypothetical protein OFOPOMKI_00082 [Aeromonas phage avDM7-IJDJ]UYD59991.1 hypothetical protein LEHPIFIF_00235 [Aeromonas phage avDM9-HANS]
MNIANKLYRFKNDSDKIEEFINRSSPTVNKRIYEALKDTNFALKLTATSSVHYIAVDIHGDRIFDEFDYDFNETEVKLFLTVVEHIEQPIDVSSLIDWVKAHNHGDLPFDKVVAMYNIAKGE